MLKHPDDARNLARPPLFFAGGFTDYFRKPGELGWAPKTLPAHDFLGRDALAADAAAGVPGRVLVGLTWNPADVAGVLSSVLGDGEIPEQMEIPRLAGPSFDQVFAAARRLEYRPTAP